MEASWHDCLQICIHFNFSNLWPSQGHKEGTQNTRELWNWSQFPWVVVLYKRTDLPYRVESPRRIDFPCSLPAHMFYTSSRWMVSKNPSSQGICPASQLSQPSLPGGCDHQKGPRHVPWGTQQDRGRGRHGNPVGAIGLGMGKRTSIPWELSQHMKWALLKISANN